MQLNDRLVPLAAVHEVVPVGDQVAERAALVTEGHAAVHAARALATQLILALKPEVRLVVGDALLRVALVEADPMDLQKAPELTHSAPPPQPLAASACCFSAFL